MICFLSCQKRSLHNDPYTGGNSSRRSEEAHELDHMSTTPKSCSEPSWITSSAGASCGVSSGGGVYASSSTSNETSTSPFYKDSTCVPLCELSLPENISTEPLSALEPK